MTEPNELTRELLNQLKKAGYEWAEIGKPDYDCQDINAWRGKSVAKLIREIGIEPLQLNASTYFYVNGTDLTPGEYDLTEEAE